MDELRNRTGFICDMDGVIYHGNRLLNGVKRFFEWLQAGQKRFLFLTNSSERTPAGLAAKLADLGIKTEEEHFYTSAQATAAFLASQKPGGTAWTVGEDAVVQALEKAGIRISDSAPDWLVFGKTESYSYSDIRKAVRLVRNGTRLIGTNPDLTGPGESGIEPATGALISPIELATSMDAYFVGKPNPLMMRHALKRLHCRREETAIIGDRMDTDIVAGLEAEIETVLVLSGVTSRQDLKKFSYRPHHVLDGVGEIVP